MLKKIASLFFVLSFFLLSATASSIHAFGVDIEGMKIPYIQCGNGESDNPEARQCCVIPTAEIDFSIPIPFSGRITDFLSDKINPLLWSRDKARKYINKWELPHSFQCIKGEPQGSDPYGSCECVIDQTQIYASPEKVADRLCKFVGLDEEGRLDVGERGKREKENCIECVSGLDKNGNKTGEGGVWTGAGCVYSDFETLITQNIIGTAVKLAGLIALLCIIYSAIKIQLSRGNPEEIQKSRERLTSCILGFLLIIFSVLVLRVIGIDILGIPGLG